MVIWIARLLKLAGWLLLAASLLLVIVPLLAVAVANTMPACTLTEGGGHGCIIGGKDKSDLLTGLALFAMAWPVLLLSLPGAGLLLLLGRWLSRRALSSPHGGSGA